MMSDLNADNFWSILTAIPEPKHIGHRLYYDQNGNPIAYSMEEMAHEYIDIDADTFWRADMTARVVDGKLIFKQPKITVNKLQPANHGTPCDPKDVCIVVSQDQPNQRWTIKTDEID